MPASSFKGNKQALPQKICQQCQRPMVWRKNWARNWDSVQYCSERCRSDAARQRRAGAGA